MLSKPQLSITFHCVATFLEVKGHEKNSKQMDKWTYGPKLYLIVVFSDGVITQVGIIKESRLAVVAVVVSFWVGFVHFGVTVNRKY